MFVIFLNSFVCMYVYVRTYVRMYEHKYVYLQTEFKFYVI
jgi:hypothetical protein